MGKTNTTNTGTGPAIEINRVRAILGACVTRASEHYENLFDGDGASVEKLSLHEVARLAQEVIDLRTACGFNDGTIANQQKEIERLTAHVERGPHKTVTSRTVHDAIAAHREASRTEVE